MIGSRAIWDASKLNELFLTRAQPWSIGLSAIGGMIHPLDACSPSGLHLRFGTGGRTVRAAIGPGLFSDIEVQSINEIVVGERIPLRHERSVTLAFDGERDMTAHPDDELEVELSGDGPWVVDTRNAIVGGIRGL